MINKAQAIIASDFDIDNLDNPTTNDVAFKCAVREDDDGEPISGFMVVGKNSDEYQAVMNSIRIANLQRSAKRKEQIDAKTEEGAGAVVSVLKNNDRAIAMAIVVDWFGFSKGGVPVPFDKKTVEAMFDKFPTWQTKVLTALEKDSNFTKV